MDDRTAEQDERGEQDERPEQDDRLSWPQLIKDVLGSPALVRRATYLIIVATPIAVAFAIFIATR